MSTIEEIETAIRELPKKDKYDLVLKLNDGRRYGSTLFYRIR